MNKQFIGLGLAFVGGTALGAGLGYFVAVKRLNLKYNEVMEAEIARTKAFYDRVHKTGDFATPESAAEALGVAEAADAVREYRGEHVLYNTFYKKDELIDLEALPTFLGAEEVVEEFENETSIRVEEEHNVFQDAEEENIDITVRHAERPYQITTLEFAANEPEYEQLSATYYAGDKIVADDQDKPIADVNRCVGLDNLQKFGTGLDPNTIHVRNERLRTDYEISISNGKYAHEVAGFQHSDETFRPMRRGIRRSADE